MLDPVSAAETLDSFQRVWAATTRSGERVVLCSVHLLKDPTLASIAPLGEVQCSRCTEPVEVTVHAARRWEQRLGWLRGSGANAIHEFVKAAYVPEHRPKWLGVRMRHGQEALLNRRFTGVALLKHRSIDKPSIITVLTNNQDSTRPGWNDRSRKRR
jgi:hypothetical protein